MFCLFFLNTLCWAISHMNMLYTNINENFKDFFDWLNICFNPIDWKMAFSTKMSSFPNRSYRKMQAQTFSPHVCWTERRLVYIRPLWIERLNGLVIHHKDIQEEYLPPSLSLPSPLCYNHLSEPLPLITAAVALCISVWPSKKRIMQAFVPRWVSEGLSLAPLLLISLWS